jgi:hypothetical protein
MTQCDMYCQVLAPRNAEFYSDEFPHRHMSISRPRFKEYIARVKRPGERRYTILGKSRSKRKAFRMLADAMQDFKWKRGDVLADEGPMSYYEPALLVEMKR